MPLLQPSLRHQLLARVVPALRGARELDTPEQERARIERQHARRGPRFPSGFARHVDVDRQDTGGLATYVLTARDARPDRTVVYLHGGGFVAGIDPFHVRYAAKLATALDARVLLPDYPLAPEHTWRDSHDALVDLVAGETERSPRGVVLAGDSAGGGIALALALSLRDRGGPQPTHLVLHAPWVDLTTSTPDTEVVTLDDPWLFPGKLHAYAAWWAGAPADLFRPEVSSALGDLTGLPPALVFCGTRDTLMPGCRLLRDRAAESGWPLTYVEAPGLIHVFPLLPLIPEARRAWRLTQEFLR